MRMQIIPDTRIEGEEKKETKTKTYTSSFKDANIPVRLVKSAKDFPQRNYTSLITSLVKQ